MAELVLRAVPASPGTVLGDAYVVEPAALAHRPISPDGRAAEAARAVAALERAAADVEAVGERLRAEGRADEAAIVETGALMARDPALADAVAGAVRERGVAAPAAIAEAAEVHAVAIAALPDAMLAARADDVRSVARRAARLAAGAHAAAAPPGAILLAADLGPADVAELGDDVAGIALAGGGPTAHAAILARSLGIPMVVGAGPALLGLPDGVPLALDGAAGTVVAEPGAARRRASRVAMTRERSLAARAREARDLPARTRDGLEVRILVNAGFAAEVAAGLRAGAEGVGLLRTELAFLDAGDWPAEDGHRRALAPVLRALRGRPATVRVLDFGADKSPPFLRGDSERGTALLLAHPAALDAQLRAILDAGRETALRVLFPMIVSVEELAAARDHVVAAARALDVPVPPVGAMVEVPAAAAAAGELARIGDFLSIGTNDLTHATLESDRFGGAAAAAVAHHPRVLAHIARTIEAAHEAGVPVEVCGEAAADTTTLPLLVGLGVDELSAGAARVGALRAWVRALSRAESAALAEQALTLGTASDVAALVAPAALLLEGGDPGGERLDGVPGVLAVGPQP
jgi:phosphoenolpyruvate-protein kinase (PTS system EI component)